MGSAQQGGSADALSHIELHRERVYAAMIRSLDRGVGQVLDALKANGLEENTLVIFTSDNGGAHYIGLPDVNARERPAPLLAGLDAGLPGLSGLGGPRRSARL